jgi:hypothetical protein
LPPLRLLDPLDVPAPTPGRLDFFRIHALAWDRIDDVIGWFLPEGREVGGAYWEGHHPLRPEMVRVNLLTGAWAEPNTGRSGQDLVSLVAYLFGLKQGAAASALARKLKVEVIAYA